MVQLKTADIISTGNVRLEEGDLNSLILSMGSVGQITPITVIPWSETESQTSGYAVVAGHRRLAAAKRLEWETIEAYVLNGDRSADNLTIQVAENVARSDLTPYELAQGLLALKTETGMSQDRIAEAVGLDKRQVSEMQKMARGMGHIDPILLNQMSFEELSVFEAVHDLDANLRAEFEAGYSNAEDRNETYWYVHKVAEENKRQRWMRRKDNAALISALLDAGAVPMEEQERGVAKALYNEEVKAHEGQPCHGFWVAKNWQADDGYSIFYYCLDPESHAKDKDKTLKSLASQAQSKGIRGTNQDRAEQKARKQRKLERKAAVVAMAKTPKMKPLTEAMYIVLLFLVKEYKWNELGKAFELKKETDQFHYDWAEYLDRFAGRDKLVQQMVLAIGSVYISMEGNYGRDPEELIDLDRIFGVSSDEVEGNEEEE
jgi:ParB/RepB/Spo0J family partition protein